MDNFNEQIKRYFESAEKIKEIAQALQTTCENTNKKLDNIILLEKELLNNVQQK